MDFYNDKIWQKFLCVLVGIVIICAVALMTISYGFKVGLFATWLLSSALIIFFIGAFTVHRPLFNYSFKLKENTFQHALIKAAWLSFKFIQDIAAWRALMIILLALWVWGSMLIWKKIDTLDFLDPKPIEKPISEMPVLKN